MKKQEATELGQAIAVFLQNEHLEKALGLLAPILAERTRFPILERIGISLASGKASRSAVNSFMERIAVEQTMGGWVVIGGVLNRRLGSNTAEAFKLCKRYADQANIWYGADILGERIPGPALVNNFSSALPLLKYWRSDPNQWVRRMIGVGVHVWAKHSKGQPEKEREAKFLLSLLEPMFGEWEIDAVKGIGWGIKTIGKHYPDLLADWLKKQLVKNERYRSIMLRKAMTYLSDGHRKRVLVPS